MASTKLKQTHFSELRIIINPGPGWAKNWKPVGPGIGKGPEKYQY
jgi:hypothetical protein